MASVEVSPKAPKRTTAAGSSPSAKKSREEAEPFSLQNYEIEWAASTNGEDAHLGGLDLKRMAVTGTLIYEESCGEKRRLEVGVIKCVRLNCHWVGNNGWNLKEVMSETQSLQKMSEIWFEHSDEEKTAGDLLVIDLVRIHPAHRGHGLGLFLIEAADSVKKAYSFVALKKQRFRLSMEEHRSACWNLAHSSTETMPGTSAFQERMHRRICRNLSVIFLELGLNSVRTNSTLLLWVATMDIYRLTYLTLWLS